MKLQKFQERQNSLWNSSETVTKKQNVGIDREIPIYIYIYVYIHSKIRSNYW